MIKERVVANFHHPKGVYGRIAGRIMSSRDSNVARNRWVADMLNPSPDAYICEIGHGPGIAIEHLWPQLTTGRIVGVEISELMSQTAARRNKAGINVGRVDFRIADSASLPGDLDQFDLIFGVNASMFWPDTETAITALAERLAPGGELVLVFIPPPTSDQTAASVAVEYADRFARAGLTEIRHEEMDYEPPAIATRGRRSQ
jgi:SAM-dependent methyltransferase